MLYHYMLLLFNQFLASHIHRVSICLYNLDRFQKLPSRLVVRHSLGFRIRAHLIELP